MSVSFSKKKMALPHCLAGETKRDHVLAEAHHLVRIQQLIVVIITISAEKAMAPHSSTLAWKIPWTEEPGRLQSMGWLGIGHD